MSKIEWSYRPETLSASEIEKLLTTQFFGLPNLEAEQAQLLTQLQEGLRGLNREALNSNWAEASFLVLPPKTREEVIKIVPELKEVSQLRDPLEMLRVKQKLKLERIIELAPALMLSIRRLLINDRNPVDAEVRAEYELAYKLISTLNQGGQVADQLYALLDQGLIQEVSPIEAQQNLEELKLPIEVRKLKRALRQADVFDEAKKALAKEKLSASEFNEYTALTGRMSLRLIVTEHHFYKGLIRNNLKGEDLSKAQSWLKDLSDYSESGWLAKMSQCSYDLLTLKPDTDYYQVLGLENAQVTAKEIKSAYRKKAMLHHPDQMPLNDPSGTHFFLTLFKEMSIFSLVKKAYETLSDEAARQHYDMMRVTTKAVHTTSNSYPPAPGEKFRSVRTPGQPAPGQARSEKPRENRTTRPRPENTLSEEELYGSLEGISKKDRAEIITQIEELRNATTTLGLLTLITALKRNFARYKLEERKVDVIRDEIISWGSVIETLEFLTYRNRIDHQLGIELFKSYLFKLPRIHGLWQVVEEDLIRKDHQVHDGFYSAMLKQVKESDAVGGHNRIREYSAGML